MNVQVLVLLDCIKQLSLVNLNELHKTNMKYVPYIDITKVHLTLC